MAMSVLVFAETENGIFKKSSLEAISYGKETANRLGTSCIAAVLGSLAEDQASRAAQAGADSVAHDSDTAWNTFTPEGFASALSSIAQKYQCDTVIISNTYAGKSLGPRLAVRLGASMVSGVISLPETSGTFAVQKTCFSNKAIAKVAIQNARRVLAIVPNSYEVKSLNASGNIEALQAEKGQNLTQVKEVSKITGKIPLTEAEVVVSAGRGLKGPENWGMIEDLADLLNAATACSKPVSDMDWRPHSEHVGQTGITIKPNLYIAVGISGAIQHLAGVGSSKVICVINTDPEAPFFKAADYGIVGDAFEVVPKLLQRAREVLSEN
jgi:electron transfer flavoprotein alpha subunit